MRKLLVLLMLLISCNTTTKLTDNYQYFNAVSNAIDKHLFATNPNIHKISGTRVYDATYTNDIGVIVPVSICIIVTEEFNAIGAIDNMPLTTVGKYYYINGVNVTEVQLKEISLFNKGLNKTHDEWISYAEH